MLSKFNSCTKLGFHKVDFRINMHFIKTNRMIKSTHRRRNLSSVTLVISCNRGCDLVPFSLRTFTVGCTLTENEL